MLGRWMSEKKVCVWGGGFENENTFFYFVYIYINIYVLRYSM